MFSPVNPVDFSGEEFLLNPLKFIILCRDAFCLFSPWFLLWSTFWLLQIMKGQSNESQQPACRLEPLSLLIQHVFCWSEAKSLLAAGSLLHRRTLWFLFGEVQVAATVSRVSQCCVSVWQRKPAASTATCSSEGVAFQCFSGYCRPPLYLFSSNNNIAKNIFIFFTSVVIYHWSVRTATLFLGL